MIRKYTRLLTISGILCLVTAALMAVLANPARAVTVTSGKLEVTWNEPVFDFDNILPGNDYWAEFTVSNLSSEPYPLMIEVEGDGASPPLASQLKFDIFFDGNLVQQKTLEELWNSEELDLDELKGDAKDVKVTFDVEFDDGAGNEYQGKSVKFDLIIGNVRVPVVAGATTEREEPLLGAVTGADQIYLVLAALTMIGAGLLLHRRTRLSPSEVKES